MYCIDLFAGAGGLTEGFLRQGFKFAAHIEKDHPASLTLKTRAAYYYLKRNDKLDIYIQYLEKKIDREYFYSKIPKRVFDTVINNEISDETIEDIFKIIDKNKKDKPIDLIIGGPPCQAYSLVGRARDPEGMKNDSRNDLYKQYIKFLIKYSPKMFVFENVMGLLSAKNGEIFNEIKEAFLAEGYNIDFDILNSSDFGVVQTRKRIILIGWKQNIDFKYPKFKKSEYNYTIKELFEDLPKINAGEKYIKFNYNGKPNSCLKSIKTRVDWDILSQHEARPNNVRDLEIYKLYVNIWNKENRKLKYNELPERLITHNNKESFLDRFNVLPYEGISPTVVAHISKDGHYYIHPDINQNRSISIREAARIQSFPDDFYFEDSRTSAFKQIGNAVPPLMAESIAKKIKKTLVKNKD